MVFIQIMHSFIYFFQILFFHIVCEDSHWARGFAEEGWISGNRMWLATLEKILPPIQWASSVSSVGSWSRSLIAHGSFVLPAVLFCIFCEQLHLNIHICRAEMMQERQSHTKMEAAWVISNDFPWMHIYSRSKCQFCQINRRLLILFRPILHHRTCPSIACCIIMTSWFMALSSSLQPLPVLSFSLPGTARCTRCLPPTAALLSL